MSDLPKYLRYIPKAITGPLRYGDGCRPGQMASECWSWISNLPQATRVKRLETTQLVGILYYNIYFFTLFLSSSLLINPPRATADMNCILEIAENGIAQKRGIAKL